MTKLEQFLGRTVPKVKSIAWFGFAADPPTIAHRKVVEEALKKADLVIVFPAGKVSYKKFSATDFQRIEMAELWKKASNFKENLIISHFEVARRVAYPWIELWEKIQKLAPEVRHSLVIGSDQYEEIPKTWDEGVRLRAEAEFIVVPREDGVSSTRARGGAFEQVDELVKEYILEHKIY